jgi:hypothetical protein
MMSWHLQGNIGPLSHEAFTSGGTETFGSWCKTEFGPESKGQKKLTKELASQLTIGLAWYSV